MAGIRSIKTLSPPVARNPRTRTTSGDCVSQSTAPDCAHDCESSQATLYTYTAVRVQTGEANGTNTRQDTTSGTAAGPTARLGTSFWLSPHRSPSHRAVAALGLPC
jgi:hypothetical protein